MSANAGRSVGSMGWITESAVQPRQARPIQVDQASVVNLKATLYAAEQELKSGAPHEPRKKASTIGVSAKTAARDQKAAMQEALEAEERVNRMHEKVALYQKLANMGSNDGNSLIDFERKNWEEEAGFVPAGTDTDSLTLNTVKKDELLDQYRKTLTYVEKQMVKEVEAETEMARQRFNEMQAKRQQDIEQRKALLRERKRRRTAANVDGP